MFSVVGRQVIVSHRRPSWLKKRLRPRSFQRSRTSLRSVAPCHFRFRCFRVCVVGGRRCSFPKPTLLHTTGTNPSGVPRRVPTRTRVLHTIGYLSQHLPLRRLWWLFGADIPEPLSLSLFHLRCSQHVSNRWNPLDILGPFLQDSEHLRLQNQNPQ